MRVLMCTAAANDGSSERLFRQRYFECGPGCGLACSEDLVSTEVNTPGRKGGMLRPRGCNVEACLSGNRYKGAGWIQYRRQPSGWYVCEDRCVFRISKPACRIGYRVDESNRPFRKGVSGGYVYCGLHNQLRLIVPPALETCLETTHRGCLVHLLVYSGRNQRGIARCLRGYVLPTACRWSPGCARKSALRETQTASSLSTPDEWCQSCLWVGPRSSSGR